MNVSLPCACRHRAEAEKALAAKSAEAAYNQALEVFIELFVFVVFHSCPTPTECKKGCRRKSQTKSQSKTRLPLPTSR